MNTKHANNRKRTSNRKTGAAPLKRTSLSVLHKLFMWCKTSSKILSYVETGALLHDQYQHYVSFDNLLKMVLSETMYLRRGDSSKLDDWQECQKYGSEEFWKRTFLACWNHERAENVAMWWLYANGKEDYVRISLPRKAFYHLFHVWEKTTRATLVHEFQCGKSNQQQSANIQSVNCNDVIYADVRCFKDDEQAAGPRNIEWDGVIRHLSDLNSLMKSASATGVFKNYEWRFERETRICVLFSEQLPLIDQVRMPFPLLSLPGVRITASPWMSPNLFERNKRRWEELLCSMNAAEKTLPFCPSVLEGVLHFRG